MKIKAAAPIFLFLFIFLLNADARSQIIREAKIQSVQSETKDGIVIKISVPKDKYKLGEEIVIDYNVTNTNAKMIRLVTDSELEIWSKDWVLWLESPIKYASEHQKFNYEFIDIAPKKIYKGKIVLDSMQIPYDRKYAEETWKLQVGFAYSFNLAGIENEYNTQGKLLAVAERSVTVNVGSLIIDIDNTSVKKTAQ